MALVEGAEIILAGWAAVTAPMLAHARRLRFIEKWGIGVDRIDVEAARRKGIPLAITAGSNAGPVAELTIALILGVYRRLAQVDAALRRGVWLKAEMREIGYQITGKTVGLVGFGNIGRKVAQRLRGFDCRVVYFDERRADAATETALGASLVPLERLLAESDIVSLHCPLTEETARLVRRERLATMRATALLVNTARGGLVDEGDLARALEAGTLGGAALDVLSVEPPPGDHPLLRAPRCIVTPHQAWTTFAARKRLLEATARNVAAILAGQPVNVVNA
jgi:D-3-phosphoglycerate dehydrogenase